MAKLVKCYGEQCTAIGRKWEKDKLVKIGDRNYCLECAAMHNKEVEDRTLLYNLISQLYNIPFPNGLMLRQIKQYKVDRKYTYENMRKALLYAHYVQHTKFHPKFGLGLIPYVIDEAVRYHDDQVQKAKNMEGKNLNISNNVITKKVTKYDRHEKMRAKMVKMEDLNL